MAQNLIESSCISQRCARHTEWCCRLPTPAARCRLQCRDRRRTLHVCAADGERFDESAASVRRLLKRDRKDLQASSGTWQPEWDDSLPEDIAAEPPASRQSGSPSTSSPATPMKQGNLQGPSSPFGSAGDPFPNTGSNGVPKAQTKNLFSTSAPSANPFDDPKDLWNVVEPMETDDRKWWQKVTFGQVALGLSFLLVIGLMFGTFYVTVKLGGVSFND